MHLEQRAGLACDENDLGHIALVASAVGRLESKVGELRAASVLVEAGGAAWQMLSLNAPEANILATARNQRLWQRRAIPGRGRGGVDVSKACSNPTNPSLAAR